MPNTLQSYASEVVPVQPTTRFFDPAPGLNIMQRYGMSGSSRAFAEDALKSANEIDKAANYDPIARRNNLEQHEWNRKIRDREDADYEEKKDFESTLGEFLTGIAAVDPMAADFDAKMAALLADPAAARHEAVKAIYNLKVSQREQNMQDRAKDLDYEKRLADELGSRGFKVVVGEDGRLDRDKTFGGVRDDKLGEERTKAEKDRLAILTDAVGKEDGILFDPATDVDAELGGRIKGLVDAGAAQKIEVPDAAGLTKILNDNPSISKEAFVAQVTDLGKRMQLPEGADRTAQIVAALNNKAELPPELKPVVASAERVWNAHFAKRQRKPAAGSEPVPTEPTPNRPPTNDKYF